MRKTTLVIMAAGAGSRFGGPKQITPVGPNDEKIIDYSIYDAIRAGFDEIVFVVNEKMMHDFKEAVGNNAAKHISVKYAVQRLDDIPTGFTVPQGRTKPWGTGHAIYACRDIVDNPFMVINADDFYGSEAFVKIHDFLVNIDENEDNLQFTMAGYRLENTLPAVGTVSRGICETDENGYLKSVTERTKIMFRHGGICFTDDDEYYTELEPSTVTSLNCWGFDNRIMAQLPWRFEEFLEYYKNENTLKCEFFLPTVVNDLVNEREATVKVVKTGDKWYGMTYKEDRETVAEAVKQLVAEGKYPERLWNN